MQILFDDLTRIIKNVKDDSSKDSLKRSLFEVAATLATRKLLEHGKRKIGDIGSALEVNNLPELIRRTQGNGPEIIRLARTNGESSSIDTPEATNQVRLFEDLLRTLAQVIGEPLRPLVRIACGRALATYFVPETIQQLRNSMSKNEADFDIEIRDMDPSDVNKQLQSNDVDFGITSFEDADKFGQLVASCKLPMKILFDRKHELEGIPHSETQITDRIKEKMFQNMRIAIQDPVNRPKNYAIESGMFPTTATTVEVKSWGAAMAMTLAGGNICCTAMPQFIDPRIRCQFREFDHHQFPQMLFAVRRCSRAGVSVAPSKLLDAIGQSFEEAISRLQSESRKQFPLFGNEKTYTAHTTMNPKTGNKCWMLGEISKLVITPEGYLQADHKLFKHWEAEGRWGDFTESQYMHLTIDGHVLDDKELVHVVWTGKENGKSTPETYATELVSHKDASGKNTAIGVWSGRRAWNSKSPALPSIGWFAILPPGLEILQEPVFAETLNAIIKKAIDAKMVFDPKTILDLPDPNDP